MAKDPALPRRGTRITTAEGDWQVQEVMPLGRAPLHYAVRVLVPAGPGGAASRISIVLSRTEYEGLQTKALELEAARRAPRPAKLRR